MASEIFNIEISQLGLSETTKAIFQKIEKPGKNHIVTANSEMLYLTTKDERLRKILQAAEIVTPDGVGAVWAAKKLSNPVKERVAGFDLFKSILEAESCIKIFLLGAKKSTVEKAADNISRSYRNVKVVGYNDGFFEDSDSVVSKINCSNADILFVALGCPKQEYWISDNLEKLNVKVAMGVGGSFDVIAGEVKRAPKVWQKLGLEWAYRLIRQPTRFFRMLSLPKFVIKVFLENKNAND
ncbi:MAG: WecB/TagA/CpsF family glycosyltransferase [Clostridia bacterium]